MLTSPRVPSASAPWGGRRSIQPSSARGVRGHGAPPEHDRSASVQYRDACFSMDKVTTRLKELENSTAGVQGRLVALEKLAEERFSRSQDGQECMRTIRGLQSQIENINDVMQQKVNIPQFREATQTWGGMEETIARLSEMATMGSERLRQLEHTVQQHVAAVDEDMRSLRTDVRNTQGQLEQSMAVWARNKSREASPADSQQVWENVNAVQSKVRALEVIVQKNLGGDQLQNMKNNIANMHSFLTNKKGLQDLDGAASSNQMQDIKNALREMARNSDLLHLKQTCSDMQMKLTIVEKVAQDKVSMQRLQQHCDAVNLLDQKVGEIQTELSVGMINIENTRGAMAAVQTKLGRLEHSTSGESFGHSGADIEELRHGINSVKSQLNSLDQIVRSKAEASQLQSLGDAMESMERKLLKAGSQIPGENQAPLPETGETRVLDATIASLKSQVKDLEQATADKVEMDDYRHVKSTVSNLQAQLASLTQVSHENVGMDTVQQFKTSILSLQAQVHSLKQELGEKADAETMQKVKGTLSNVQLHVTNMEQSVQERAGCEQMHHLSASVAEAKSKLSSMEQHKAEASAMQQLQDTFAALQSKMPSSERVQQMESTLTSLGRHVTALEQGKSKASAAEHAGFADVHTQVELQHFKGVIAGMEKKLTDVEQDLQDKVGKGELQQCRKAIHNVEAKLINVEQLLNEKAGTTQLQQLQGVIQTSISSVEQMVHEKVGPEQLHPLKASISGVQANVASVEQSLHEKVGTSQMQQLKGNLAIVQNKACGLEQAIQEKAQTCQVQQLKDALCKVETKMSGVEQSVREANTSRLSLAAEPFLRDMPPALKKLRSLEGPVDTQR